MPDPVREETGGGWREVAIEQAACSIEAAAGVLSMPHDAGQLEAIVADLMTQASALRTLPPAPSVSQQGRGERATAVERITTIGEARDVILGELKAPPAGRAPEQYARDIAFKLRDFGYLAPAPSQQEGGGEVEVFARDECTFRFCPHPDACAERCAGPWRGGIA